MNISDPFYNSIYTLTSNQIDNLFLVNTVLSCISQLVGKKERYLHINQVLYKHQTNGRLD